MFFLRLLLVNQVSGRRAGFAFFTRCLSADAPDATGIPEETKNIKKLVPDDAYRRKNPFLKPLPAWLRDFQTLRPIDIIPIPAQVFDAPIRTDIMHRVVHWYRASLRAGTASTKHRSDVAGSRRKLYQQKGTGKARAGARQAPHRRGGATCFGPKPRDWSYALSIKVRNLGLRSALTAKFKQGELSFITDDSLMLPSHKTKELARILDNTPFKRPRILLIHYTTGDIPATLRYAANSLKDRLTIMNAREEHINVFHLLKGHVILLTESALRYYQTLFDKLSY